MSLGNLEFGIQIPESFRNSK